MDNRAHQHTYTHFFASRRSNTTTKMTTTTTKTRGTPLLVAVSATVATAMFAATLFPQASAARSPSTSTLVTTTASTTSSSALGRSLLGSGSLGAQGAAAPPPPSPPPPRRLTPREMVANGLVNLLQNVLTAQGGAERDGDEEDDAGVNSNPNNLGGEENLTSFNSTSVSTAFVRKLVQEAQAASLPTDASAPFVGDGDIIPLEVQQRLCEGEFLRGGDGAGYNATEADLAYASAYPLHRQGIVPVGCLTGCIVGGGLFETIARVYGIQRTGTPSAWKGKCFTEEAVVRRPPSTSTSSSNGTTGMNGTVDTWWQPGTLVKNRIKMNYGIFINRLFGLAEPLELFPGKVYTGESYFAPGERAVIIDYEDHDHEFSSFRDEIREIYPGVYLGKMYALPGTELWGGVLALPPDSDPRFTINFILFGQPGMTTQTVQQQDTQPAVALDSEGGGA